MHTGNMVGRGRWWFLVEESLLLLLLLIPFPTFFVSNRSPLCVNFFYFFLLPVGDLTFDDDRPPTGKQKQFQPNVLKSVVKSAMSQLFQVWF